MASPFNILENFVKENKLTNRAFRLINDLVDKVGQSLNPTDDVTFNDLTVNGFSTFGESSPSIKMKKLTGTTGVADNTTTAIAHGLTQSKIISATFKVTDSGGVDRFPEDDSGARDYRVFISSTTAGVRTSLGDAGDILSAPITILIIYEA